MSTKSNELNGKVESPRGEALTYREGGGQLLLIGLPPRVYPPSDNLQPGDLVTGAANLPNGVDTVLARPAGTIYWTMQLPQCCIMIVVEPPARRSVNHLFHVTVFAENQLVEVFIADIQRLGGASL